MIMVIYGGWKYCLVDGKFGKPGPLKTVRLRVRSPHQTPKSMTTKFRPIVAIELLLSGKPVVYHTDGLELVGPTLTEPRQNMVNNLYVVVSYLTLISKDDDAPESFWHKELYTLYFPNETTFHIIVQEITEGFQAIHAWMIENAPMEKHNPLTPHYGWFIPDYPTLNQLHKHLTT